MRTTRHLTIAVRLADSPDLPDAFDRGEIDAAIIDREDDRRDGEILAPEHFGWFATPDFVYRPGEPLRLASSSPSCRIRNIATCKLPVQGLTVRLRGATNVRPPSFPSGLTAGARSRRQVRSPP
jgi:DNA-binding transcriptional LysR family regulator